MQVRYITFWRPAYEAIASGAWLFGAAAAFAIGRVQQYDLRGISVLALPFMGFSAYRLAQTCKHWKRKLDLSVQRRLETSADDIVAKHRATDYKQVWIGRGFEWQPECVQLLTDINSLKPEDYAPPKWLVRAARTLGYAIPEEFQKGLPAIHGLSSKEQDLYVSLDALGGMAFLPGTTGAGKTRLFEVLLIQAINRPAPSSKPDFPRWEVTIVIDPKGDKALRDRCYEECVRSGDPDRFYYFSPTHAECSIRLNPIRNYVRLTQIASRITALLPNSGSSANFRSFAWRVIETICGAMHLAGQDPTIASILRNVEREVDDLFIQAVTSYLRSMEYRFPTWAADIEASIATSRHGDKQKARLTALRDYYDKFLQVKHGSAVIDSLISLMDHQREHYNKLIAVLIPVLKMLTSGPMEKLISPDYHDPLDKRPIMDLRKLVDRGGVLYISLENLADGEVGAALGSVALSDLTSVAAERQLFKHDVDIPVNLFVDEVNEIANEPLIQLLNKGRSAGFRVALATQTMSDLAVRLGSMDHAMQFLGNTNTTLALRLQDPATREFIAKKFDECYIQTLENSMSTTGYSASEGMDFGGSYGKRLAQTKVPFVSDGWLGLLPDLHYFGNLPGGRRVKGRIPFLRPTLEYPMTPY